MWLTMSEEVEMGPSVRKPGEEEEEAGKFAVAKAFFFYSLNSSAIPGSLVGELPIIVKMLSNNFFLIIISMSMSFFGRNEWGKIIQV